MFTRISVNVCRRKYTSAILNVHMIQASPKQPNSSTSLHHPGICSPFRMCLYLHTSSSLCVTPHFSFTSVYNCTLKFFLPLEHTMKPRTSLLYTLYGFQLPWPVHSALPHSAFKLTPVRTTTCLRVSPATC
ncbi:unnamed protein product [Ectocarpus sp. 4 AP-2014]